MHHRSLVITHISDMIIICGTYIDLFRQVASVTDRLFPALSIIWCTAGEEGVRHCPG